MAGAVLGGSPGLQTGGAGLMVREMIWRGRRHVQRQRRDPDENGFGVAGAAFGCSQELQRIDWVAGVRMNLAQHALYSEAVQGSAQDH